MDLAIPLTLAAMIGGAFALGYAWRATKDRTRANALWDLRARLRTTQSELVSERLARLAAEHREAALPPVRTGLIEFPPVYQINEGPADPYKPLRKRALWAMRNKDNGQNGA